MKSRRWLLTAVLFGPLVLIANDPAAAGFDPRNHGDLSGVILLCATEPGSPRFDAAWRDWLRTNPDADVDGAIQAVLSRAGTVRSMAIPGMAPAKPGSRPDPDAVAAHMTAIARQSRTAESAGR